MEDIKVNKNGWRPLDTNRHHRENLWDYKGRAIYHITLCVAERKCLLGELTGNSETNATISLSPLGAFVDRTFRDLPSFYAAKGIAIKILALQVMPDHLHGIIQVLEPMPKSIGEVIRSFKSACTSMYINSRKNATEMHNNSIRKNAAEVRNGLWEMMPAGYHERILHCDKQLDRMIKYVKDNPRRLWTKRKCPELFTMHRDVCYQFTDENGGLHKWRFRAMGNMYLWNWPQKQYIQCSRVMTQEELEKKKNEKLQYAAIGYVSVTPAINVNEVAITRAIREAGYPTIVLLKDGFPKEGSENEKYFKPRGVFFDLCEKGKLLLLEPNSESLADQYIADSVYRKDPYANVGGMRYHFLALNCIAMTMANCVNK